MIPTTILRMYGALVGIGLGCSVAIVSTYELTRPIIQANRDDMRQQAVLRVIPGAETSVAFSLTDDQRFEPSADRPNQVPVVYAGYDRDGQLRGLAIEAEGFGYQDSIRLMYGYSFDSETITAIEVLESRETPGLGDRIETDEGFLSNFDSLSVKLRSDRTSLLHEIEFVKQGEKETAWQVDGITGATISSRAVAEMLSESTAWWIPRVNQRREDFAEPKEGVQRD